MAIAALIVAACDAGPAAIPTGAGPGTQPVATGTGATADPVADERSGGDVDETTFEVNQTFWHGGWKVTMGQGRVHFIEGLIGFARPSWAVSVDATFENLSRTGARFNSLVAAGSGGVAYTREGPGHSLPFAEPGEPAEGVLQVLIPDDFDFDDAVLLIGQPHNNQARIPLGPSGGNLLTLEPISVDIAGQLEAPAVTLTILGGELRADIWPRRSVTEKGSLALFIDWSVRGIDGVCRREVGHDHLGLILPSGATVEATDQIGNQSGLILRPEEDFFDTTYFIIEDPPVGQHRLTLTGRYGGQCGSSPIETWEIPFNLDADFPTQ